MKLFSEMESPKKERANRVIAYCDQCGFAVYESDEALLIPGSEDIIHTDCWADYADEHMFELAKRITDCEDLVRV